MRARSDKHDDVGATQERTTKPSPTTHTPRVQLHTPYPRPSGATPPVRHRPSCAQSTAAPTASQPA